MYKYALIIAFTNYIYFFIIIDILIQRLLPTIAIYPLFIMFISNYFSFKNWLYSTYIRYGLYAVNCNRMYFIANASKKTIN